MGADVGLGVIKVSLDRLLACDTGSSINKKQAYVPSLRMQNADFPSIDMTFAVDWALKTNYLSTK